MSVIFRFKYVIACLTAISMITVFFDNITDQKPDNVFEATLIYGEDNMQFSGISTYSSMPGMISFYLEDAEPVICSIHILKLSDEGLKKGEYLTNSQEEPRSGVVCGVPYTDEHDEDNNSDEAVSKERVSSISGEVIIMEVSQAYVSGSFDVTLNGNKSGKEFKLTGKFTSYSKI
ncbi:hypothetical protein DYD21_10210 [Rhodohalobacter sp. SW132]|nr:hypothetical protein DYD21_10210 [Rhodohalobacter sp. SW132]